MPYIQELQGSHKTSCTDRGFHNEHGREQKVVSRSAIL